MEDSISGILQRSKGVNAIRLYKLIAEGNSLDLVNSSKTFDPELRKTIYLIEHAKKDKKITLRISSYCNCLEDLAFTDFDNELYNLSERYICMARDLNTESFSIIVPPGDRFSMCYMNLNADDFIQKYSRGQLKENIDKLKDNRYSIFFKKVVKHAAVLENNSRRDENNNILLGGIVNMLRPLRDFNYVQLPAYMFIRNNI